jgi:hypothetical protein
MISSCKQKLLVFLKIKGLSYTSFDFCNKDNFFQVSVSLMFTLFEVKICDILKCYCPLMAAYFYNFLHLGRVLLNQFWSCKSLKEFSKALSFELKYVLMFALKVLF